MRDLFARFAHVKSGVTEVTPVTDVHAPPADAPPEPLADILADAEAFWAALAADGEAFWAEALASMPEADD